MKILFAFKVLIFLFFLASCQTVTISPKGRSLVYSGLPSYERSHNFFFWGLMGDHSINIQRVCEDRSVKQMQTQQTFLNGFVSILTLGIYTPRTARVWCGKKFGLNSNKISEE